MRKFITFRINNFVILSIEDSKRPILNGLKGSEWNIMIKIEESLPIWLINDCGEFQINEEIHTKEFFIKIVSII